MKVGILFDLDGTLMDTLEDLMDGVNHALRSFGCPERSLAEIRRFVGNGAANLIRRSLPGREDDPDAGEVLAVFRAYYDVHCQEKTRPYDGILDALAALQEKYPMAIVSNKPDAAVKSLGQQYFPGIYARGESADCPRKPAPDMVYRAMEAIGVEKCVYVGDSEVDVVTAANAGVPCLSVLWGFRDRPEIEEAGGRFFCEKTEDLVSSLENLLQNEENNGK